MIGVDTDRTVPRPVTLAGAGALPTTLGMAVTLSAVGLLLVLAAVRVDWLAFDAVLWKYCLGLLYIGALAFWESTRRRTGTLPSWTSPPALIAGWTLVWVYAPALVPFFDESLIARFEMRQGGEAVLANGLLLTCAALTVLSLSFHVTSLALPRPAGRLGVAERPLALRRVVALYLVSTAARAFHLLTVGVAYGTDLTAWGALEPVAQWIGYVEDLRFLALALLVAHVVRRRAGYLWLAIPLFIELMLAVSSAFLTPVVLPIVLCVATAATFDRMRVRHVVLIAVAGIVVSTFVPVIAAIRQDRLGAIGTTDLAGVVETLTTPGLYWANGVSSGEGVYDKFFGRQAEVASAPGLVMALTPTVVAYEGLEQFLTLPAGLIPRAVWADKPTLSRGVWFSSVFRGLEPDTTSYSSMTIFSEGYLFYGWTGMLLSMLIAGVALAVVRRRLDGPRLALVYLALVPTILQIEPEFSSYLTMLVQRSLVFVVVFLLLTHSKDVNLPTRRIGV